MKHTKLQYQQIYRDFQKYTLGNLAGTVIRINKDCLLVSLSSMLIFFAVQNGSFFAYSMFEILKTRL